ncbi:major facilitator family transporter [Klebsiella pneumoniae]|uniref:Major facilitator family transporter n=1 Tax=Klebsiella pneumoniae TaxID=573 RepID=A0A2X3GY95_KLEPN|nr:major facilitator family transporter [Klebsiella pneumoniae]
MVYGLAGFGYIITATYLPLFLSGSLQSVDPVHLWRCLVWRPRRPASSGISWC